MSKRKVKPERDLEKVYSTKDFVAKLRRLDLEMIDPNEVNKIIF